MLKRLVKEAANGFSSSGEQTSRRKQTSSRRRDVSSDDEGDRTNQRSKSNMPKSKRQSHRDQDDTDVDDEKLPRREETPTEEESTRPRGKLSKEIDTVRRKKASRMKREPLLELSVIETIHSAMHGKKKKRARQELLDLFASYDPDDTGLVDADKFKKCIAKVGIKIKRSDDVEALIKCFTKSDHSTHGDEMTASEPTKSKTTRHGKVRATTVDYVTFIDFACNARDSETLSAIAEKLRETIHVYDDKHDRVTSVPYNIASDLKKMDKSKRGWISSDRFAEFMHDHERPTFRVGSKDVAVLTERFEYEYATGTLGVDYYQFAQWLQPMLHLDKKQLHARVKRLVLAAQETRGWELSEVFEAIDGNGDGHVSGAELKQALLDMGLPLTDAQIQCLVEEYDVDGDGKIQHDEFVSLFEAPIRKNKKTRSKERSNKERQHDGSGASGSESERTVKKRAKAKANVRNTFSWAIHKAFARKHAQGEQSKGRNRNSSTGSSDDNKRKVAKKNTKHHKKSRETEESASDSEEREKPKRKQRMPSKKAAATSSEDVQTSDAEPPTRNATGASKKATTSRKKKEIAASTESESDRSQRVSPRRKRIDSMRARTKRKNDGSDAKKASRRQEISESSDVPRKRDHRSLSTVSRHSRKESVARSRTKRGHSTSRASPRRRSSVERTRSDRPTVRRKTPQQKSKRTASPRRMHDEIFDAHESDASISADSQSGLDLSQVRDLQRQPRKKTRRTRGSGNQSANDGDGCSNSDFDPDGGDDDDSKSDREYARHLEKALRRAFDFFDLDHSATIEKRELSHVLRALGHEFSSTELDREMRRVDLDRNGALDFYEFVQFVKNQLAQKAYLLSNHREMEIRRAFQAQDSDKNGYLDETEFEYLIYKVLQVELSVEEQDALLGFVDPNGDGVIHEDEFIAFMKSMEGFHRHGAISKQKEREMLDSLDGVSKLACSALKKLVRGAPIDLDKNLLMLFGIPSNFRPALTTAAVCRALHENSMEHALSFPCPETVVALAQDPTRVGAKKEASMLSLTRLTNDEEDAKELLGQAESWESHAIVSLKRATGIPKPYDTREDDVVRRCVHVCLYQEHDDTDGGKRRQRRHQGPIKSKNRPAREGSIVGNVLDVPVYWNPLEEDVWAFSKKATKEDKYKFLVRTNNVNDRLFLLVEYIVHLRIGSEQPTPRRSKRSKNKHKRTIPEPSTEIREMAACWCKIPIRTLLAKRLEVYRAQAKLWGGTVQSPIDIEQDEILRRRTGWRAITQAFKKPTPPAMGIKSAPIGSYPDEIQGFVRKMPPLILAPFVALPVVAEYMVAMQGSLWLKTHTTASTMCEPVLKLLPRIIDDHEALSVFRRAFDTEMNGLKSQEDRQPKFKDLVLRMWPSFLELLDLIPSTLLQDAQATAPSTRRLSLLAPAAPVPPASGTTNERPLDQQARSSLLQCTAQGKLRLRDMPVAAAPFHVREVTFDRLI